MNSSWSLGERMRRTGREYFWAERSGGEGRGGVVGVGSRVDEAWDRRFVLDRNSDNFLDKSTLPLGAGLDSVDVDAILMREDARYQR